VLRLPHIFSQHLSPPILFSLLRYPLPQLHLVCARLLDLSVLACNLSYTDTHIDVFPLVRFIRYNKQKIKLLNYQRYRLTRDGDRWDGWSRPWGEESGCVWGERIVGWLSWLRGPRGLKVVVTWQPLIKSFCFLPIRQGKIIQPNIQPHNDSKQGQYHKMIQFLQSEKVAVRARSAPIAAGEGEIDFSTYNSPPTTGSPVCV